MNTEKDKKRIIEFLDLLDNESYDLRRYSRPILVYIVKDGTIYYSVWEEDILRRYGLENVDGWDFKEDSIFCPDWVIGVENESILDELDEMDEIPNNEND